MASSADGDGEFDLVCALCDNGGVLLCCEGKCLRSFHATVEDGFESMCDTLGFSDEQLEEIEATQTYYCKNCQYNQHQCFACGELGSSDKASGAEVFRCNYATCGHFYHPKCLAKLFHLKSEAEAEELQEKITTGEPFLCPAHRCVVCEMGENEEEHEMHFAMCRRCPRSYHRKCLPREIIFDDSEDEDIIPRAWEGLLPNCRILIYCLKHEIDTEIGTPKRNHIKFPNIGQKRKQASELLSIRRKFAFRERNLFSEYKTRRRSVLKQHKGVENSSKKSQRILSRPGDLAADSSCYRMSTSANEWCEPRPDELNDISSSWTS